MSHLGTSPNDRVRLDGRNAVITGAARGIGREVAARFAGAGATVILSDLDERMLRTTVEELQGAGADVRGHVADASDPVDVEELFRSAMSNGRGPDIVVANAGRMFTQGVEDTSADEWSDGLRINLTSTFLTARAALPALRSSEHGRFLAMASMAAFDPRTVAGVPYAVAKAGIAHLVAILAVELGGSGATANAIAPGAVETDMSRSFGAAVLKGFASRSPLGRIGTPQDVSDVALFLAADLGGFVNGQTIRVSGGP